jgi:hypothetical protein
MTGYVQKAVLAALREAPDGLTTSDLPGFGRHSVHVALKRLGARGLVHVTGYMPPGSPDGRGGRLHVWQLTDEDRAVSGDLPSM